MSKFTLEVTIAEWNHINNLLERNIQDGVYSGNKSQYWARHDNIKAKMIRALAKADGK
jgi:hypothetical protein